ncbi:MAG: hypothetical protein UW02_C0001G0004 [Candidatus Nomurabacteria bacterium GW2011_GWB1_43_7]|uniref:Ada DNA repair metal-binding domain-containing protein n=1 Tax=Candidatus Nomurabacteria bacterium GW2011_GWB1_43_7 TaxID=1618747 RepID=A0A0G1FCN5_9BACT|nr:MAG: hypothetical protein UW02_C0001G0004 [Candidatus Nomurabacteria bacterium GW2011_GWB1_43_7]
MEKIKQFLESKKGKDILIVLIIILVSLGSFELGRLSKEASSSGIKIEYATQGQEQTPNQANAVSATENTNPAAVPSPTPKNSEENYFFASNRGNKYYPAACSAGKNIKQENRVYFATREEAEKAGYELSSSCY